ncbi:hypothetical protein SEA_JOLENE_59 [Mycobacterium phage Jolene]|uniref:Uncharacterized protein n=3 Tax=Mycobacterium virus Halo TaxID=373407 RepID=Q1A0L8_9CAUD|nr:hypothetical protein ANGEL_57 [Mycobacterium phage Angel]YP_008129810.1 hypothetical protein M695_gp55 [Mycobacterium phage Leo]YP_655578.1 hypothetical protein Halo60 [Mycobacterium phage Halo]ACU41523.1 hypothetical protein HOPE_59 [Mycobacterium phage Hope]AGK85959.1 hypothetical protein Chy3_0055 [Mycobacterium phage Chy3]AID18448.1 hypothetical protein [Mycobacterium phage Guo1]AKY02663.1 hypothetical protein SEA_PHREAK_59 [Mycobacterium phage Phreak]ALF00751.1 hypothetical protein S
MHIGDLFMLPVIPVEECDHCGEPSVDCNGRRMHVETDQNGARTVWEECRTGAQGALFGIW